MSMETRQEQENRLEELLDMGTAAPAVQFLASLDAPRRHVLRKIKTEEAIYEILQSMKLRCSLDALLEVGSFSGGPDGRTAFLVRDRDTGKYHNASSLDSELVYKVVLLLDLVGTGGPHGGGWTDGFEGGTDRLLSGLGKSRWYASDGGAYRAAASEAFEELFELSEDLFVKPFTEDAEGVLSFHRIYGGKTKNILRLHYAEQPPKIRERMQTLARAALRSMWNQSGVVRITHCTTPLLVHYPRVEHFIPEDSLRKWANFYNHTKGREQMSM